MLLAIACGGDAEELPEPDPLISTDPPSEELTEVDYGQFDPSDIGINMPWTRNVIAREIDPQDPPARLTSVSTDRSRGYDRVVFTFAPAIPGYRLTRGTVVGGGCDGTEPLGEAAMRVVVEFTGTVSNDGGSALVEERDRATGFPALVDAIQACDEGGTVRWVLGASGDVDYRIMEIRGSPQLVVDLRHPSP